MPTGPSIGSLNASLHLDIGEFDRSAQKAADALRSLGSAFPEKPASLANLQTMARNMENTAARLGRQMFESMNPNPIIARMGVAYQKHAELMKSLSAEMAKAAQASNKDGLEKLQEKIQKATDAFSRLKAAATSAQSTINQGIANASLKSAQDYAASISPPPRVHRDVSDFQHVRDLLKFPEIQQSDRDAVLRATGDNQAKRAEEDVLRMRERIADARKSSLQREWDELERAKPAEPPDPSVDANKYRRDRNVLQNNLLNEQYARAQHALQQEATAGETGGLTPAQAHFVELLDFRRSVGKGGVGGLPQMRASAFDNFQKYRQAHSAAATSEFKRTDSGLTEKSETELEFERLSAVAPKWKRETEAQYKERLQSYLEDFRDMEAEQDAVKKATAAKKALAQLKAELTNVIRAGMTEEQRLNEVRKDLMAVVSQGTPKQQQDARDTITETDAARDLNKTTELNRQLDALKKQADAEDKYNARMSEYYMKGQHAYKKPLAQLAKDHANAMRQQVMDEHRPMPGEDDGAYKKRIQEEVDRRQKAEEFKNAIQRSMTADDALAQLQDQARSLQESRLTDEEQQRKLQQELLDKARSHPANAADANKAIAEIEEGTLRRQYSDAQDKTHSVSDAIAQQKRKIGGLTALEQAAIEANIEENKAWKALDDAGHNAIRPETPESRLARLRVSRLTDFLKENDPSRGSAFTFNKSLQVAFKKTDDELLKEEFISQFAPEHDLDDKTAEGRQKRDDFIKANLPRFKTWKEEKGKIADAENAESALKSLENERLQLLRELAAAEDKYAQSISERVAAASKGTADQKQGAEQKQTEIEDARKQLKKQNEKEAMIQQGRVAYQQFQSPEAWHKKQMAAIDEFFSSADGQKISKEERATARKRANVMYRRLARSGRFDQTNDLVMQAGYGIEDAAMGYEYGGVRGAIRGAANNLGYMASLWHPWAAAGVAGLTAVTMAWSLMSREQDKSLKLMEEHKKSLIELDRMRKEGFMEAQGNAPELAKFNIQRIADRNIDIGAVQQLADQERQRGHKLQDTEVQLKNAEKNAHARNAIDIAQNAMTTLEAWESQEVKKFKEANPIGFFPSRERSRNEDLMFERHRTVSRIMARGQGDQEDRKDVERDLAHQTEDQRKEVLRQIKHLRQAETDYRKEMQASGLGREDTKLFRGWAVGGERFGWGLHTTQTESAVNAAKQEQTGIVKLQNDISKLKNEAKAANEELNKLSKPIVTAITIDLKGGLEKGRKDIFDWQHRMRQDLDKLLPELDANAPGAAQRQQARQPALDAIEKEVEDRFDRLMLDTDVKNLSAASGVDTITGKKLQMDLDLLQKRLSITQNPDLDKDSRAAALEMADRVAEVNKRRLTQAPELQGVGAMLANSTEAYSVRARQERGMDHWNNQLRETQETNRILANLLKAVQANANDVNVRQVKLQ